MEADFPDAGQIGGLAWITVCGISVSPEKELPCAALGVSNNLKVKLWYLGLIVQNLI